MLKASFYAGMAFTRAYVGYVHAIGHNLGGMYGRDSLEYEDKVSLHEYLAQHD